MAKCIAMRENTMNTVGWDSEQLRNTNLDRDRRQLAFENKHSPKQNNYQMLDHLKFMTTQLGSRGLILRVI